MKHSDNENDNNNVDSSQNSNKKLNINSRTLGIYEQYLRKTIQDLTREQDSRLNEDYKSELDNTSATSQNISSTQKHEDTISADISHLLESRPTSSFKLLMIGVIGGLILSAVSVFMLNITGILPALTERLASFSASTPTVSTTVETSTESVATVDTTSKSIDSLTTQAVTPQLKTTQDSPNLNAVISNKDISTQDQTVNTSATEAADKVTSSTQNSQSIVSYEDFTEEAQDTLYQDNQR